MNLSEYLGVVSWRDVIDVFAVALVVYYMLLLIRGTRAVRMVLGIVFLGAIYYLARLTDLTTLETFLGRLLIFLPFAIIVLFQHEIRRALVTFGRAPRWELAFQGPLVEPVVDEIVAAANALAARHIGALVVIERSEGLRDYIENGIALDAVLSFDLLRNIFTPESPLHDGAVIIQNDRIAAAACFLPLTSNPELSQEFGTRHRAALGISEETDAVAVVVSEEKGKIAVACESVMQRNLDPNDLRNVLFQYLTAQARSQRRRAS